MDQPSILSTLVSLTAGMTIRDVIDILMVSLVFFLLFNMLRRSRSQTALRGLVIVLTTTLMFYLLTLVAELNATKALITRMWVVIVLIFLIVFQSEFKKALTDYGRLPVFRRLFRQESAPLDEIVKAVARLAEKKIGALICIERENPLRSYIETGTVLDSLVSAELLRTVFAMYTPLHDGAVIVRGNRISAAGCLLPLTEQELSKDLGTRHRAAVGMAEETDAVVVVVSEETGTVSLAVDGALHRPETTESLREKLLDLFELDEEEDDGEEG